MMIRGKDMMAINLKEWLKNSCETVSRYMRCMDYTANEFFHPEEVLEEKRRIAYQLIDSFIQKPSLEQENTPATLVQPTSNSHFVVAHGLGIEAKIEYNWQEPKQPVKKEGR